MKEDILAITGIILIVAVPSILLFGWVRNLVLFTQLDFKPPYKAEIIRGLSLSPIGVITGYIKIEDK